jgi:hypothetical protein
VAICNWGRLEDREVHAIFEPLAERKPRAGDTPAVGEPGVLEELPRQAVLSPEQAEGVVRTRVVKAAEPCRRPDGS